jgi:hypothetical protein
MALELRWHGKAGFGKPDLISLYCSLSRPCLHKLRVFENRVLRRILGPKRDGVTGGWRKLYNICI